MAQPWLTAADESGRSNRRAYALVATLLGLAVLTSGCRSAPDRTAPPAYAPAVTVAVMERMSATSCRPASSDGLRPYLGDGYAFSYPVQAEVEARDGGAERITGPTVEGSFTGYSEPGMPAYEMDIRVHDNPEALGAEEWARRNIMHDWREGTARAEPMGSLPIGSDGEWDEGELAPIQIAEVPAFRARFFAFDGHTPHYYVAAGQRIVEIWFKEEITANVPLAAVQLDVYSLLLSTFCFDGSPEASAAVAPEAAR